MKKTMALLLSAALLALPVSPAVAFADTIPETTAVSTTTEAEEPPVVDSDGKEVKPGTLPDSPVYWLDELAEKLQVALTFNPEKKVKLIEKQACERLAEILALAKKVDAEQTAPEAMESAEPAEPTDTDASEATESTETTEVTEGIDAAETIESTSENTDGANDVVSEDESANESTTEDSEESITEEVEQVVTNPKMEKKFKACEKALKGYNAKIEHAQEFLTELEDPNSEEYKKLQEALAKVNANNVLVLGNLLEKLPPQASQRLAVNIVRSMEKAVEKMEKIEEKNKELVDEERTPTPSNPNVDETKAPNAPEAPTTEVTAPVPGTVVPVAPVAPVPNTTKKDAKDKDNLSKKEYKELAKEAKSALKQLKRDLGLIGPDKEKSKDNDKKSEPQLQKVNYQSKYNNDLKSPDKAFSDNKEIRGYDKDNKGWKDHGRDDDWGDGKGNRDRD